MNRATRRFGWLVLLSSVLAACGGDSGGGTPPPPPGNNVAGAIAAAAANPANDTSTNLNSAFSVLQNAGVPAVVVRGRPAVNFTVFSDGAVRQGLVLADMSFAIAKLVPAVNSEPARWQSYVSRFERPTGASNIGSGPNGTAVLAEARQATTDPKTSATLVWNPDGYYTYTFSTNIQDLAQTFGVAFEPNRTTRIAIQLSYKNAAGQIVRVNPYFDVTFDANGNSVAVTDPAKTQVISVVSQCNGCHEKLALHGGGRVDVQYCVMCHNPGTTDANSGNVLSMATMTHKIHAGRFLARQPGGQDYVIWGFRDVKHDYSDIGYPQDLRNCVKCHNESNKETPQGGFWRTNPVKETCLTCHGSGTGSQFYNYHLPLAQQLVGPNAKPLDIPNSDCAFCHRSGSSVSAERVHWNQNEEHALKYKVTIDSTAYDPATRKVTVKYYVADTTNNNAKWNLVTSGCTGSGAAVNCGSNTQFGNLRLFLAYQNIPGQPQGVTEFTAYNNGGSSANVFMYKGVNDGSNTYTIDIPVPPDNENMVAQGTARVVSIGQIKEPKLEVKTLLEPRPPVVPTVLINVLAINTSRDVVLSGAPNPRRVIVTNEKCDVCHGSLGSTSGSNTLSEAFHGGARNTVESCALCHDQNRYSSTVMTSGQALSENYSFKRMIHGIHGNSRRTFPFTHGNNVIGAFDKAGILTLDGLIAQSSSSSISAPAGTLFQPWSTGVVVPKGTKLGASGSAVENYAAEVAYPQVGLNCAACHVNNSWQQDPNPVGSVVQKPIDPATGKAGLNPLAWRVITPQAASCTACHDSPKAIAHVVGAGGASFGQATQAQNFQILESCADCHRPGQLYGVDVVHQLK